MATTIDPTQFFFIAFFLRVSNICNLEMQLNFQFGNFENYFFNQRFNLNCCYVANIGSYVKLGLAVEAIFVGRWGLLK